jgi:hypothetical protein
LDSSICFGFSSFVSSTTASSQFSGTLLSSIIGVIGFGFGFGVIPKFLKSSNTTY